MTTERTINCIFYSHIWALHALSRAGVGRTEDEVVIELATESNFACLYPKPFAQRLGLEAILTYKNGLEKVAASYEYVPAPLILASYPAVTSAMLESAVALLATSGGRFKKASLLVQIDDAVKWVNALHHVNRFQILWDLADPPSTALVKLATTLSSNDLLRPETWGGLIYYRHQLRRHDDLDEREAAWKSVMAEFPVLKVA